MNSANGNTASAKLTIAGGTFVTSHGFQNITTSGTGSGVITLNNGGVLALSANIPQLTSGTVTNTYLTIGGGAIDTSVYSTTISNVINGSGSLTKLGAGTLTLSASNTFTGSTTISNGTLLVNGSIGTNTVTVLTSGTLGGVGTVGGAVTLNGTVAPGSGAIGTLTTTNETWNGGGAYQFSLNSATNSAGWDLLTVNGTLNIQSATTNPFIIKLVSLTSSNTPGPLVDFSSAGTNIWLLATASGSIQNFNPAKFVVDTTGFSNAFTGTFAVTTNAGSLQVAYTGNTNDGPLMLTYVGASSTAPSVANPSVSGSSTFSFSFSGTTGQSYHVYSSTNLALPLAEWQVETSGMFGADTVIYSESATNNPQKYFRVGSP
jgi:autotransporter-associated beta strand protein